MVTGYFFFTFPVFSFGKMGKIIVPNGKNIFPNRNFSMYNTSKEQWNSKSEQFIGVEKR